MARSAPAARTGAPGALRRYFFKGLRHAAGHRFCPEGTKRVNREDEPARRPDLIVEILSQNTRKRPQDQEERLLAIRGERILDR